jgi:hypothetical protein
MTLTSVSCPLSPGTKHGPRDPYAMSLVARALLRDGFYDFRANDLRWLWVPHRASLVRDDGGGFGFQTAPTLAFARCSEARCPSTVIASAAKQSMATSATKLDCFASLAMTAVASSRAVSRFVRGAKSLVASCPLSMRICRALARLPVAAPTRAFRILEAASA